MPLSLRNHHQLFTLNGSSVNDSPSFLGIRMRELLEIKAHNTDPIIRAAILVGVALRSPNRQPSIDPNSFREITVIFHLTTTPPRPGVRENILFKSVDGSRWQQSPRREEPEADWYRLAEFHWAEVESQMSLKDADGRIKAAGYEIYLSTLGSA
ncbi:MAG: hypothetical protein Q9182_003349 [Xanthomendoza sp. 2 TL-2023]